MTSLASFLNSLQSEYHRKSFLYSDPLEFVHRYSNPFDQEAVALVSALLAYGNVKQIRASVTDALSRLEKLAPTPEQAIRPLGDARSVERAEAVFAGFVHRFNRGADLVLLLRLLARSWSRHGSLGAQFVRHLEPSARDFSGALSALIAEWRQWADELGRPRSGAFDYLLTSPEDGSCCKRWCMFLRWMGRKDELDPGLWSASGALASTFPPGRFLSPSQLVIPLDTHTGRISQYLGLTSRKSLNWLAAEEVTAALRKRGDPLDPVRYDFALARLGILDRCQRRYRREICGKCQLLPACRFAAKAGRA